jgi:hypothetical protein
MAGGIVLRRITSTEGAGLERLFFELTTSSRSSAAPADPTHTELTGAAA